MRTTGEEKKYSCIRHQKKYKNAVDRRKSRFVRIDLLLYKETLWHVIIMRRQRRWIRFLFTLFSFAWPTVLSCLNPVFVAWQWSTPTVHLRRGSTTMCEWDEMCWRAVYHRRFPCHSESQTKTVEFEKERRLWVISFNSLLASRWPANQFEPANETESGLREKWQCTAPTQSANNINTSFSLYLSLAHFMIFNLTNFNM